jgi:hypothetical protein
MTLVNTIMNLHVPFKILGNSCVAERVADPQGGAQPPGVQSRHGLMSLQYLYTDWSSFRKTHRMGLFKPIW